MSTCKKLLVPVANNNNNNKQQYDNHDQNEIKLEWEVDEVTNNEGDGELANNEVEIN